MKRLGASTAGVSALAAGLLVVVGPPAAADPGDDLAASDRITFSRESQRIDLRSGDLDGRLTGLLNEIVRRHSITISSLKTDHSPFVAETNRYSNHYLGRGVDISVVDGVRVEGSRPGSAPYALGSWLRTLSGDLQPSEVGQPWWDGCSEPVGCFTNRAHKNHIHIGFGRLGGSSSGSASNGGSPTRALIANVSACGALYIKQGFWGSWDEHMGCGQAQSVAISPDGQTVMVVQPGGALVGKQGLWGQWQAHVAGGDSRATAA